jgi:hypothetical protein
MRRTVWRIYLVCLCVLATTLAASSQLAPAPPSDPTPVPPGCNIPRSGVATASIVQATGDSLQRKHWQPQGGVIQFTVKSFAAIPNDASFFVCYRWKTDPESTDNYQEARPDRLDRNNDGTIWTVTTTVPDNLKDVPPGATLARALPLVPLADVRILVVLAGKTVAADATTVIGITHPLAAIGFAVLTIVIVLIALNVIADYRLTDEGIRKANWFLRIISTPSGYASLSQLQIVLWTLVVATSAVYVMALSGDLIEITSGTLVLLGIAGAAALGAKAHTQSQNSAAQAAADAARQKSDAATIDAARKAVAAANAAPGSVENAAHVVAQQAANDAEQTADAAEARAKAFAHPPAAQAPRWTDLIVNETTGVNGTIREIDVTRFQMLLFTLITATFVVLNVLTTYVIPEIPTGFLTLMGISNGVYLGAKVAQGS